MYVCLFTNIVDVITWYVEDVFAKLVDVITWYVEDVFTNIVDVITWYVEDIVWYVSSTYQVITSTMFVNTTIPTCISCYVKRCIIHYYLCKYNNTYQVISSTLLCL